MFEFIYFSEILNTDDFISGVQWLVSRIKWDQLDPVDLLFNVFVNCNCDLYGSFSFDGTEMYKFIVAYCESKNKLQEIIKL